MYGYELMLIMIMLVIPFLIKSKSRAAYFEIGCIVGAVILRVL